jgi:glucose/arabinose dehydrogenase
MLKHIKNTLKSLALNVTLSAALFGVGATLSNAGAARAAVLPPGFTETQVGGGLTGPTAMAIAPDGRVFACEQRGRLRVIKNGVTLPTSFVNVTVDSSVERGLIGVVLHPNFATNGWVYIYYTQPAAGAEPARNRIVRYTAQGDVAAANSATPIFDLSPLGAAGNHNGGAMHFGPDGKLYVAVGENAYPPNAQSLDTLHGKFCASTKTARSRPTTRSTTRQPATTAPSTHWACATRSRSTLTP